jgi:Flp pilus assembly pilin Flp
MSTCCKGVNKYMTKFQMFVHDVMGKLMRQEEGQTAVEYALVLALIAIVLVVALAAGLDGVLSSTIGKITSQLT